MGYTKIEIKQEPVITTYKVYDDYVEFFTDMTYRRDFHFKMNVQENWFFLTVEGTKYAVYQRHDDRLLTMPAYNKMINESFLTYEVSESDLIRQRASGSTWTGEHKSIEDVIDYLRNDKDSWLPTIYKELEEARAELTKTYNEKLNKLLEQTNKLMDDDYLRSRVKTFLHVIMK